MAADIGALFNAGPKVVEGATFEEGLDFQDLGGPMVHCTNGTIDNLAANEAECFEQLRVVLSYLPNSGSEAPPVISCADPQDREDIALRSIIPRRQARMYNARTIITSVVDQDSWFEIGALWGRTAIGGLARLGGRPVGIISLNCEINGGALDAAGSQKLTRLLKLCDVMNLPVLQFLDVRKWIYTSPFSEVGDVRMLTFLCFKLDMLLVLLPSVRLLCAGALNSPRLISALLCLSSMWLLDVFLALRAVLCLDVGILLCRLLGRLGSGGRCHSMVVLKLGTDMN
jgi:hypothetical protein